MEFTWNIYIFSICSLKGKINTHYFKYYTWINFSNDFYLRSLGKIILNRSFRNRKSHSSILEGNNIPQRVNIGY